MMPTSPDTAPPRHRAEEAECWRSPLERDGLRAAHVACGTGPAVPTCLDTALPRHSVEVTAVGLQRPVATGGARASQAESARGDPAHCAGLFRPISVQEALARLNADHPTRLHPQWQTATDDRPAKERQEAAAKVLASKRFDVAPLCQASIQAPGSDWTALFSA